MTKNSVNRRAHSLVLLLAISALPSCYSIEHTVGSGPVLHEEVSQRQWYLLFGFLHLGQRVDSKRLAGNATSYRVRTEWSFTDMILNLLTTPFTVTSRTVTIEK
ncbi:MAG: hypothetical protein H6832_00315 [Planctomycetes bacterium]|nr:hypothetical protein [Planctomycetota bacterium]MCB9916826.1 hypothetical protein [Planctomycetota bacterium]